MEIDWMTPNQTSERWGISGRRVQALCAGGQVEGAVKLGLVWLIPKSATKPPDGRTRDSRKKTMTKQSEDTNG